MSGKTKHKKSNKHVDIQETKIFKIIFYLALTTLALILIVQSFTGGYSQYGYSFLRCGRAPVAVSYHFAEYKVEYSKPGDANYPGPNMFIKYVCTEQEAEALNATYVPSGEIED